MASKTTLNAHNLEALGTARLAELLMELSAGDGAAQRRLRLELAGAQGAGEVARAVRRRLAQAARARGFVDWRRRRELIEDLETQRRAIAEHVAPEDPAEALDLLWRLLALAGSVHERCDDSDGLVGDLFRDALVDLGSIAAAAPPDPEGLADQAFDALRDNGYAQYDGLVASLAPALGERGLAQLEGCLRAWAALPAGRAAGDGETAGRTGSGADGVGERALRERRGAARLALMDIADARGDADGFIAQFDAKTRRAPTVAAAIAHRLLAAGRAEEALAALDAAEVSRWLEPPLEWHAARLEALDAVGRSDEAQAARWARFEAALSEEDLRAHLKRLPDFDDLDAEERALEHAARHPDVHAALAFLVRWPALDRAAALVLKREREIDGDAYRVLTPAAESLAERHPLAATLTLRAMIDFALREARSSGVRGSRRADRRPGRFAPARRLPRRAAGRARAQGGLLDRRGGGRGAVRCPAARVSQGGEQPGSIEPSPGRKWLCP